MKPDTALESLIQRYLDGVATAQDLGELNGHLRSDAAARSQFMEMLNLDSALAANAAGWLADKAGASTAKPVQRRTLVLPALWLAAAACLALAGAAWWWQGTKTVFATVHKGAGAEELAVGMPLRGEVHEIKNGAVEFITSRGARIVVEAPALFQFESAQRLHLMRGRVAAEVPPAAKGFTVITPTGSAVDLGTKFGVDVPVDRAAEIHVFQGEVIAQPSGGRQHQSVRGGQAVTLQSTPGGEREFRSAAFIRSDELTALSAGLVAGQRARAETRVTLLRNDPALIALLDFQSGVLPPGTFRVVQGRWPGSLAPEFVNTGDHMKIDVGGEREWPQLSLAAWVRLDRLGAPYQSLYHTDGWAGDKPGQVHWMINHDTTMRLALQGNTLAPGAHDRFPDSLTPVLPEQGRWVHLAVVYDSVAHTVRFYLNGKFDKEVRQETAYPARLGPAQIGNWNQQDRKLSGRVGELLILGRAMNDDEVRALHAAGTPYL